MDLILFFYISFEAVAPFFCYFFFKSLTFAEALYDFYLCDGQCRKLTHH